MGDYDLTTSGEVFAFLGKRPEKDALWLFFSGTSGTVTAQVTDTALVLIDPDNGTTTKVLAAAANDTLTELVAVINAVAGWNAGVIYAGGADSGDLVTTGALDCDQADNEQTLRITDTYLINSLIERATDYLERRFNRKLKTRTFTNETHPGSGKLTLILRNYPVTRIVRLSAGRARAFSIKNTATDADYATVEITASAIRLIVVGGDNADDTALTLADYASIDALITAIEALGKGWSCTAYISDSSTRGASMLLSRPSMAVDATVSADCEVVDDDITDYKLLNPNDEDVNAGILLKPSVFSSTSEYICTYVGGFTTIPAALEELCIMLVKYRYEKSKRDSGMKSEKFGEGADYSYTLADFKDAIPPDLVAQASEFQKLEF